MNAALAACLCTLLLAPTLPPARADSPSVATELRMDCARPRLPPQYETGRWLEQANAGQAYASRERLMADVRRACQRPGIRTVVLQLQRPASPPERALAGRP